VKHPSEVVVVLELVPSAVRGQRLDLSEESVEFEQGVPIGSNVSTVHTG